MSFCSPSTLRRAPGHSSHPVSSHSPRSQLQEQLLITQSQLRAIELERTERQRVLVDLVQQNQKMQQQLENLDHTQVELQALRERLENTEREACEKRAG